MAGRIKDEDIALVREKSPIDDVVGEHVQLRNAGGGNLKGICPFHDEKSPSFNVTPARGLFYCFGCQAGGDVIRFVQDIEHVDFSEAVEKLAARAGIQLRYHEGGDLPTRQHGQRARLDRGAPGRRRLLPRAAHLARGRARARVPQEPAASTPSPRPRGSGAGSRRRDGTR